MKFVKIKNIRKTRYKQKVYDITNVKDNNNYVANGMVVHNSSEDWAKAENKALKKKLAQVRTKHLLFILCFPLKIYKVDKTYLESFVNYWVSIFSRGQGAIYVKDRNPVRDSWRMTEFKNIGSFTEFTNTHQIHEKLKKHPNYWQLIKFPKPPDWLYAKYLKVREANVYDDANVLKSVSKEDIHKALMILSLRDVIMHDTTLSVSKVILHIKNEYDISISKSMVQNAIDDSKQLVNKIREQLSNEK